METTDYTEYTDGLYGTNFLHPRESHKVLGACLCVYREKGSGFLEPVYHDCLKIEFAHQGIPFLHEPSCELTYRGQVLPHTYEPDFICYDRIVVEVKAVSALTDEHRAQLMNYLKATGIKVGYLVNFGHHRKLQYERFVL